MRDRQWEGEYVVGALDMENSYMEPARVVQRAINRLAESVDMRRTATTEAT